MTARPGPLVDPQLPADFGRYRLLRRLAVGGMAEVYLARSTGAYGLKKLLVIKQIHSAFAQNPHFVSQFIDEAKIALSLNHPNIVQVFDFGKVDERYFLAMEHVAGVDLLDLLRACDKASRRIPFGMAAYIGQQVATALDYAHRKTDEFGQPLQIVHRDVSPQNVLVSYEGSVKLLDFGIAKARDSAEEKGGTIKGKYAYMSQNRPPESPSTVEATFFLSVFCFTNCRWRNRYFPENADRPHSGWCVKRRSPIREPSIPTTPPIWLRWLCGR